HAGVLNATEINPAADGQGVADQTVSNEPVGMSMLEKYPEFPGGQDAFNKYISRNLRYPMMARENSISGRVFVSFIIEKNGSLSNIQVVRGIGGGCDDEAVRVLKNSPLWAAGMQNGQKVRVAYTIPIFFQLAE
ncbi:MAG TPA: energy transducer TonB, partial [Daejeonella sp.]|nr:energy transducer TonB [Daejeonella sp.]